MNYIIYTPSVARLKKEIVERVTEGADANGKAIVTLKCLDAEGGEKVLVHTADQWAEEGCIALQKDDRSGGLKVRFFYWDSCENQENGDDKYMLGRFTELLLVHFTYYIDRIVIE